MLDFTGMADNYDDRKVARWDSEDGTAMISTAHVSDGRKPIETAFMHPKYNGGKMVIVECYDTQEEAQAGHDKWLEIMLSDNLPSALVDCANAETSQLCAALGAPMAFERETD